MDDFYSSNEDHISRRKKKLTVFDDIFTDMVSNKKLRVLVIELFSGNICLFTIFWYSSHNHNRTKEFKTNHCTFLYQLYSNKQELQQFSSNHPPDIEFDEFKRQ